jgi:rhamnopyranosyl-N-acetylglucosaminyl-diphospho-decaprenol beta-1,3/1,4-galactofuranosyltransferase
VEGETTPRILAIVLTHNAPQSLSRCVAAIADQVRPPQELLVVDSGSVPPVEVGTLARETLSVRVHRCETNVGPAGGYAIGLREFLSTDFTHAWVMDDDILPEPSCLSELCALALKYDEPAFVFPRSIQPDGSEGRWGSWCGFLISRVVVERVGLPIEDLFWWAEDTEYCQWRIPQAGFPRRICESAVVRHDAIRQEGSVPPWKYYYEARNMLYLHLHVMHRLGRYPQNLTRLVGRAVMKEPDGRILRLRAVAKGLLDGATKRLGVRYPVEPMRERSLRVGRV